MRFFLDLHTILFPITYIFFFLHLLFPLLFFRLISIPISSSLVLFSCISLLFWTWILYTTLTFSDTPSSGLVSQARPSSPLSQIGNNLHISPSHLLPQTLNLSYLLNGKKTTLPSTTLPTTGNPPSVPMAKVLLPSTLAPSPSKIDAHPPPASKSPFNMAFSRSTQTASVLMLRTTTFVPAITLTNPHPEA